MNLLLPFDEPRPKALRDAVGALAGDGGLRERGAVFTKTGVVEAILDLCGYTADKPLHEMRFLEPSFGDGDFLLVAVDRLLRSLKAAGGGPRDAAGLAHAVRGVELHTATFKRCRDAIEQRLRHHGVALAVAQQLVAAWLIHDDFLLATLRGPFDVVAGNPPYVRQERIPDALLKTYKRTFRTLYDRADLYVMFYERGLDLLGDAGVLGYICANRWVKNKYGGPLRNKVADGFRLKFFIDLTDADAFHSDVIAYPAITVIERGPPGPTHVALRWRDTAADLRGVALDLASSEAGGVAPHVAVVEDVTAARDPWLLDAPHILRLLRRLERTFPKLEASGARVGIGVATGADRVFIGAHDQLPVEDDRKLKLAMAADCVNGEVAWSGKGIVNPYLQSGQLAPFGAFPKFADYMREHGDALKRRHTAKKQPAKWYKTIDRIYPDLLHKPKLLIPDIKGEAIVAFDPGGYYPHHNLYVVTSDDWKLQALQAVLRSSVALTFVAAYCVRMAGGFLRFQAQYLRRIRVPDPATVTDEQVQALVAVATSNDQAAIDAVVAPLYGLSAEDTDAIEAFAAAARVPRKTP